jgi:hypothetical protein
MTRVLLSYAFIKKLSLRWVLMLSSKLGGQAGLPEPTENLG